MSTPNDLAPNDAPGPDSAEPVTIKSLQAALRREASNTAKWREAALSSQGRVAELEKSITDTRIDAAIAAFAARKDVTDPAILAKLIDRSSLSVGDDGRVFGLETAFSDLSRQHPSAVASRSVNRPTLPSTRSSYQTMPTPPVEPSPFDFELNLGF